MSDPKRQKNAPQEQERPIPEELYPVIDTDLENL